MKLRIKNQLHGEIMVRAMARNDELVITVASQNTFPPAGALPVRMGETEEIELADPLDIQVFRMLAAGKKPNDIAEDLRLTRYQMYRLHKEFVATENEWRKYVR